MTQSFGVPAVHQLCVNSCLSIRLIDDPCFGHLHSVRALAGMQQQQRNEWHHTRVMSLTDLSGVLLLGTSNPCEYCWLFLTVLFPPPLPRRHQPKNQATKAELPRRFLDRLQLHHAILLPGNAHPFVGRGGIPSVSIDVEKRQGNRLESSCTNDYFSNTLVLSFVLKHGHATPPPTP